MIEENNIGVHDLEKLLEFAKLHDKPLICSPIRIRFVPNDICSVIQATALTKDSEAVEWIDMEPEYDCW